jgi:hypothetical protein
MVPTAGWVATPGTEEAFAHRVVELHAGFVMVRPET